MAQGTPINRAAGGEARAVPTCFSSEKLSLVLMESTRCEEFAWSGVFPCIGRQSLNLWTAREVPRVLSLMWEIREDREMGQRHCRAEKTPILGDFRLLKALCVLTEWEGIRPGTSP